MNWHDSSFSYVDDGDDFLAYNCQCVHARCV